MSGLASATASDTQKRKAPLLEDEPLIESEVIFLHGPPYKPNKEKFEIPPGAENFYEILGRCQCTTKCPMSTLLKNKLMPWTRFPTRFPTQNLTVWVNPYAVRGEAQVKKAIEDFMVEDSQGNMVPPRMTYADVL